MCERDNATELKNNPSQLIMLVRDVIDRMFADQNFTTYLDQRKQLDALSHAIQELEEKYVPVPESLKLEKAKLLTKITDYPKNDVIKIADELQEIVNDIYIRLGMDKGRSGYLPKTEKQVFRRLIIDILKKAGGRARASTVLDQIEQQLEGKMLPGDLTLRADGKTLAWRNNAQWERNAMREEGIIKDDSPNGIWELGESYMR